MEVQVCLLFSGSGEVKSPDEDVVSMWSGGNLSQAAAMSMCRHSPDKSPAVMSKEAVNIAGNKSILLNHNIIV